MGAHQKLYRQLAPSADPFAQIVEDRVDRMIRTQMEAYPSDWSEADKREMAVRYLSGERAS